MATLNSNAKAPIIKINNKNRSITSNDTRVVATGVLTLPSVLPFDEWLTHNQYEYDSEDPDSDRIEFEYDEYRKNSNNLIQSSELIASSKLVLKSTNQYTSKKQFGRLQDRVRFKYSNTYDGIPIFKTYGKTDHLFYLRFRDTDSINFIPKIIPQRRWRLGWLDDHSPIYVYRGHPFDKNGKPFLTLGGRIQTRLNGKKQIVFAYKKTKPSLYEYKSLIFNINKFIYNLALDCKKTNLLPPAFIKSVLSPNWRLNLDRNDRPINSKFKELDLLKIKQECPKLKTALFHKYRVLKALNKLRDHPQSKDLLELVNGLLIPFKLKFNFTKTLLSISNWNLKTESHLFLKHNLLEVPVKPVISSGKRFNRKAKVIEIDISKKDQTSKFESPIISMDESKLVNLELPKVINPYSNIDFISDKLRLGPRFWNHINAFEDTWRNFNKLLKSLFNFHKILISQWTNYNSTEGLFLLLQYFDLILILKGFFRSYYYSIVSNLSLIGVFSDLGWLIELHPFFKDYESLILSEKVFSARNDDIFQLAAKYKGRLKDLLLFISINSQPKFFNNSWYPPDIDLETSDQPISEFVDIVNALSSEEEVEYQLLLKVSSKTLREKLRFAFLKKKRESYYITKPGISSII